MNKFLNNATFKVVIWPEETRDNIDTDIIMPSDFLKVVKKDGLGVHVFDGLRFKNKEGQDIVPIYTDPKNRVIKKDFFLNKDENKGAEVLIAGKDFGCGSSREHAPWGLVDFGFKVIIASSFADIFYNNSFNNGLLLITLEQEKIDEIISIIEISIKNSISVDLVNKSLILKYSADDIVAGDSRFYFDLDEIKQRKLLEGLDDIDLLLEKYQDKIIDFSSQQKQKYSWI